jgi:hypothetical protein
VDETPAASDGAAGPEGGERADQDDLNPFGGVRDSVPAIEQQRVLLGFLPPDEAVGRLEQAEQVRNPVDASARSEKDPEEIEREAEEAAERRRDEWMAARQAISEDVSFRADEVELVGMPDDPEIQAHLDEYTGKDAFEEAMAEVPAERWRFARVPIDALVAFQPQVTTTAYESIPTWAEDPLGVLEYCFPTEARTLQMTQIDQDQDGGRFRASLTSRSPNFHIGEFGVESGEAATGVKVAVKPSPNFLQVARFQDRYILKNGYHRTYQLMRAGEELVPAVVRDVDDYGDTGGAKPGFFSAEVVLSDRPPLMPDLLSDAAMTAENPATNTVIEVTAEKRRIPR